MESLGGADAAGLDLQTRLAAREKSLDRASDTRNRHDQFRWYLKSTSRDLLDDPSPPPEKGPHLVFVGPVWPL